MTEYITVTIPKPVRVDEDVSCFGDAFAKLYFRNGLSQARAVGIIERAIFTPQTQRFTTSSALMRSWCDIYGEV